MQLHGQIYINKLLHRAEFLKDFSINVLEDNGSGDPSYVNFLWSNNFELPLLEYFIYRFNPLTYKYACKICSKLS